MDAGISQSTSYVYRNAASKYLATIKQHPQIDPATALVVTLHSSGYTTDKSLSSLSTAILAQRQELGIPPSDVEQCRRYARRYITGAIRINNVRASAPRAASAPFSASDIIWTLAHCDSPPSSFVDVRNRLLLLIAVHTGLRAADIARATFPEKLWRDPIAWSRDPTFSAVTKTSNGTLVTFAVHQLHFVDEASLTNRSHPTQTRAAARHTTGARATAAIQLDRIVNHSGQSQTNEDRGGGARIAVPETNHNTIAKVAVTYRQMFKSRESPRAWFVLSHDMESPMTPDTVSNAIRTEIARIGMDTTNFTTGMLRGTAALRNTILSGATTAMRLGDWKVPSTMKNHYARPGLLAASLRGTRP
jgi:integrase